MPPTVLSKWQSPKARVISGVPVEKAKISRFATGHIKDQSSLRSGSLPKRPGMCGSVAANPVATSRFAMDHITSDRDPHIRNSHAYLISSEILHQMTLAHEARNRHIQSDALDEIGLGLDLHDQWWWSDAIDIFNGSIDDERMEEVGEYAKVSGRAAVCRYPMKENGRL